MYELTITKLEPLSELEKTEIIKNMRFGNDSTVSGERYSEDGNNRIVKVLVTTVNEEEFNHIRKAALAVMA